MNGSSNDIEVLESEFRSIIKDKLFPKLKELGYALVPFFTVRDPWEQARLWRQSRTKTQITRASDMLKRHGALFLAEILISVGPQYGRWATNALPGQSWHQWLEAVDSFVLESGSAVWNSNHQGYAAYAREAVLLGLEAGHYWEQRDSCHIQKRKGKVLSIHSWPEIERAMIQRFGTEESRTDILANFT